MRNATRKINSFTAARPFIDFLLFISLDFRYLLLFDREKESNLACLVAKQHMKSNKSRRMEL
jgi:hypothetical protein